MQPHPSDIRYIVRTNGILSTSTLVHSIISVSSLCFRVAVANFIYVDYKLVHVSDMKSYLFKNLNTINIFLSKSKNSTHFSQLLDKDVCIG